MTRSNIERLNDTLEHRQHLNLLDKQYRKALENADARQRAAQAILVEYGDENGRIADDELFASYRDLTQASLAFERQAKGLKAQYKRHQSTVLKVRSEPRVYSETSPHSYFRDIALRAMGAGTFGHAEAVERLNRYGVELSIERRANTKEGRHAVESLRNAQRTAESWTGGRDLATVAAEAELRAVSSSTFSSVTTPLYLTQDAAAYRSPFAAFLNESNDQPLPEFGLEVFIPAWTAPTSVGAQGTENTGIDSSIPTAEYLSNTLTTMAGTVPVSQQLFDRAGPTGFDAYCIAQLRQQLDAAVDAYVIATAIATAGTVTDSTTLTVDRLYTDLSTAREQMSDAAGVRLKASHVFATSDFTEWLFAQADDDKRPLIVPDPQSLVASPPVGSLDVANPTFTGVWLNRQRLFEDDSVPAYTGEPTWAQVLVADMSKVFTWRSTAVPRAIVGQGAADLTVDIQLYQYVSAIIQYEEAVQVISGSGLASLK